MGVDPQDFDEANLHGFNRYAYGNNNPYKFKDPNGEVAETILDVVSLGLSIAAFKSDPTLLNGLALAYDAVAAATPFLPGGVGVLRQAGRAADAVGDAAKVANKTEDASRGVQTTTRQASTEFGRSVQSLKESIQSGKGPWQRTSAHAEPARAKTYRGGTSLEEVFVHQETGERIVRHTIVREENVLHETFRPFAKFGTE
jgi:hypothetical protein